MSTCWPEVLVSGAQSPAAASQGMVQHTERFRRTLREPVEDGRCHPGEAVLARAASDLGSAVEGWCLGVLAIAPRHAELASVIRLFGRAGLPTGAEARKEVLRRGLASPSVEVREAAVQAAGSWGDARWLPVVFLQHRDAVVWLGEYIDQVASDLAAREGVKS